MFISAKQRWKVNREMKYIYSAIVILLFIKTSFAQIDYKNEFGNNYTTAVKWFADNSNLIKKIAIIYGLPEKELSAIVFPEVMRYSSIYDAIEINSLKYLYTNYGKKYANFSVGYFQMKPSFAEQIEKDYQTLTDKKIFATTFLFALNAQIENAEARKQRIRRITNLETQIIYLTVFYKICQQKFNKQIFVTAEDRIRFMATCYNAGYDKSADQIIGLQSKKFYHIGNGFTGTNYCYADIAVYAYRNVFQ